MAGSNDEGVIPTLTAPSLSMHSGGGGATSNKDLMADARSALKGNWGWAIMGYILYVLFIESLGFFLYASSVLALTFGDSGSLIPYILMFLLDGVVPLLLIGPVFVGVSAFFLGIGQDEPPRLERFFIGFSRFWKSVGCLIFYNLFIYLWTLLLVIPGLIKAFSYSMAFFILADDEDCGPLEAIGRSKEMMKGNKWKFFCLHFRFLGWALLCTFLTFGIGFLWLVPYMQTAQAKFYEDVK